MARLARGAIKPTDALRIAISIAEALAVLHQHGVVHRDLKPSNVFLTPAGAKVLDGVTIGDGAVIGTAAVVREDVPARAVAVGIPARIVSTR